jgi:hypothetical protein
MKKFLRYIRARKAMAVICLLAMTIIWALPSPAFAAGEDTAVVYGDVVKVIKDYLPLLAILLSLAGQALKTLPNFKTWLLPFIMGGAGLVIAVLLTAIPGGSAIEITQAAIEGLFIGLASTGLYEAANKVSGSGG